MIIKRQFQNDFYEAIEDIDPHEHYFTYFTHSRQYGFLTNSMMKGELKKWKKIKVACLRCNFRDYEIHGKKWYYFCITPNQETGVPPCLIGLFIPNISESNQILVSGFGYLASNAKNRDMILKYLL